MQKYGPANGVLSWALVGLLAAISALTQGPARAQNASPGLVDIFGRVVNSRGVTLTDWDGYLANPAIKLYVQAPPGAALPGSVTLSTPEARMYFDLPSTFGPNGPTKTLSLPSAGASVPFHLSISPDRDGVSEVYSLTLRFTDAAGAQSVSSVPIRVVDQDLATLGPFKVNLDFSKDQTQFFTDPAKRQILEQVADDWEYFFDFSPDEVPAGSETTWIWNPDGFRSGQYLSNANAYRGYLLYTYGIHDPTMLRSGGEGSYTGGFQTVGGVPTELRRSGGVEIETAGNYNSLGWFLSTGDQDWWVTGNLHGEQHDLYSIAHHEMGHALGFNGSYPACARAKSQGFLDHPEVRAYHGASPAIDGFDHMPGVVDRASLRGAFGNEYYGSMPRRRWLITKLDLLCLKAIGYPLRQTSAFVPLAFPAPALPAYSVGVPYSADLPATGGIPGYNWRITDGSLPPGLTLDPFTGALSGTPSAAGTFQFTVEVRDYDEQTTGRSQTVTLSGQGPLVSVTIAPASVIGAHAASGLVTLAGAVEADVEVSLSSSNAAASVPASVTVPAGNTQASFPVTTQAVALDTTVTLSAAHAGEVRTASVFVKAPVLAGIEAPGVLVGGSTGTGSVALTGPVAAASTVTVSLSSSHTAVTLLVTVTVPAGAANASFPISTAAVAADTAVTLTAAAGGVTRSTGLTVKAPTLSTLTLSASSVKGGSSVTGRVTLSSPAPAGGLQVRLSDAHPAASVPAAVTVPAGSTTATFTITTSKVPKDTAGTISAILASITRSVSLTVRKK